MTYRVEWSLRALDRAAGFLKDDLAGVTLVLDEVDLLGEDPRSPATRSYGIHHLRRLRVGRYRVLFEVLDDEALVRVVHLGRIG